MYVGGLVGALLGAKLGYVLAELPFRWGEPAFWLYLLHGRTVLGALLGGYVGVEGGKWLVRERASTGDRFALIVPVGIALGRVGCLCYGCCRGVVCEASWWTIADGNGVARWPAPAVEMGFNLLMAGLIAWLWRRGRLRGQLFHVYLIGYGLFRVAHEPMRESVRYSLGFTPYQVLAAVLVGFAVWRFVQRWRGQELGRWRGEAAIDLGASFSAVVNQTEN